MKNTNIFSSFMIMAVVILLTVTGCLGVATAVKDHKLKAASNQQEKNDDKVNDGKITQVPYKDTPTPTASLQTTELTSTPTPVPTNTPKPTSTPTNTPVTKLVIALDPGHQEKADWDKEAVGPGATDTVTKMTAGATGVNSGIKEYEWTLLIAELTKTELQNMDYEVYLTREASSVSISNAERAKAAKAQGAELIVGIQADAFDESDVSGFYYMTTGADNEFVGKYSENSSLLAKKIQARIVEYAGTKKRSYQSGDRQALLNWFDGPGCIMQLGFMSNPEEDSRMANEDYQKALAKAIAQGIDDYIIAAGVR